MVVSGLGFFVCFGLALWGFFSLFFLFLSFVSSLKTKFNVKLPEFGSNPQHGHSPVLIRELDCWLALFPRDQIHTHLYL